MPLSAMAEQSSPREPERAGWLFSNRLLKRREVWWGRPFRWSCVGSYGDAVHRTRERFALRSRNEPDAAWRCCPHWQRTLMSKWNGREFVQKHGGRVPELYWYGRSIADIPFASLPARYVVRPLWGGGQRNVHVVVDGLDLLNDTSAAASVVRRRLFREHGPWALTPILIEEFVPAEGSHGMPREYKCHMFGRTVGAVQVIERTGRQTGPHRFYTPEWRPFPDAASGRYPVAPARPAPHFLAEMLDAARRLGEALGTYMRVDFFGSDAGAFFNEFSSTPQLSDLPFSPQCEELLGSLWEREFPDAT